MRGDKDKMSLLAFPFWSAGFLLPTDGYVIFSSFLSPFIPISCFYHTLAPLINKLVCITGEFNIIRYNFYKINKICDE